MDSTFFLILKLQFQHQVLIFSKHFMLPTQPRLLIFSKLPQLRLFRLLILSPLLIFSKHFLLLILLLQVKLQLLIFLWHFIEPLFQLLTGPKLLIFLKLIQPPIQPRLLIFWEHFQLQFMNSNEIFLMFKLQWDQLQLLIYEGHFPLRCQPQFLIFS